MSGSDGWEPGLGVFHSLGGPVHSVSPRALSKPDQPQGLYFQRWRRCGLWPYSDYCADFTEVKGKEGDVHSVPPLTWLGVQWVLELWAGPQPPSPSVTFVMPPFALASFHQSMIPGSKSKSTCSKMMIVSITAHLTHCRRLDEEQREREEAICL